MAPYVPQSKLLTKIILDVDGVLNMSYRDKGRAALLTPANVGTVQSIIQGGSPHGPLSATGHPMEASVIDSVAVVETGLADIFVKRLAELIKRTYPEPEVILSSCWRQPSYRDKMESIRRQIGKALGREFRWGGVTPLRRESQPQDRLCSIGAFVANMTLEMKPLSEVRLLVLDDFFLTPFNGWICDRAKISSVDDAEAYLLSCCQGPGTVSVKVVNTYEELRTDGQQRLQAAFGLTPEHLEAAVDFFADSRSSRLSYLGGRLTGTPSLGVKIPGALLKGLQGAMGKVRNTCPKTSSCSPRPKRVF